ncbi:TIGR02391 family protein [Roseomonas sp. GCM10028921]
MSERHRASTMVHGREGHFTPWLERDAAPRMQIPTPCWSLAVQEPERSPAERLVAGMANLSHVRKLAYEFAEPLAPGAMVPVENRQSLHRAAELATRETYPSDLIKVQDRVRLTAPLGYEMNKEALLAYISNEISMLMEEVAGRAATLKKASNMHLYHLLDADVIVRALLPYEANNYFLAMRETTDAFRDFIRNMTGSVQDGPNLVNNNFGKEKAWAFALGSGETPDSINRGYREMAAGFFAGVRNPVFHLSAHEYPTNRTHSAHIMVMVSFLMAAMRKAHRVTGP